MKYIATALACLLLTGCLAQSETQPSDSASGQSSNGKPSTRSAVTKSTIISVTQFHADNVIGYLGHPLGTIVRVTGTAIVGDSAGAKKVAGETLLIIQTVNGKKLDSEITFEFPRASENRASKNIEKPKAGSTFDYYVHEHGGFSGVVVPPEELGIDYVLTAHDGFHYRRYITVHKFLK